MNIFLRHVIYRMQVLSIDLGMKVICEGSLYLSVHVSFLGLHSISTLSPRTPGLVDKFDPRSYFQFIFRTVTWQAIPIINMYRLLWHP